MSTPQLLPLPSPTRPEKAFLLYLPEGYDPAAPEPWPVLLFLHGDGERGDTLDDLDYLLVLGPLYEAWIQKRDLPFLIISPQLGLFGRDVDGPEYLTKRTREKIPPRLEHGISPHNLDAPARDFYGPMTGALDPGTVPPPHAEIKDKLWDQADPEVIHILDYVLAHYHADPQRVYLTGVSLGGYGTWHFASQYPDRFAAILPVVGFGTVEQAEIIAGAGIPIWAFSGGRDMPVPTEYFFPAMNKLDELGANYRFTTEQDMGHDVWNRTYAREDVYRWLLQYRKLEKMPTGESSSAPDPTQRFSTRVENYVKYRPHYPSEVLETLRAACSLTPTSVIADIGSGTGILTELFLQNNNPVHAVEPNREMREAGEHLLQTYPHFTSVDGRAEATTLPARSVDIVTAGQAFHWFDQEKTRAEFQRILKPGGWVVLVWNDREVGGTPFLVAYEQLLKQYATDYEGVTNKQVNAEALTRFYGPAGYEIQTFSNAQAFDLDGLRGRLLSSSYTPLPGHPNHAPMRTALSNIFQTHQVQGRVEFKYTTQVFYGQLT